MTVTNHIRTFRSKKLHPEHVKLINEALRHNARGKDKDVHITYRKENGEVSERKVRPLAVKGKSLFVAHCHERNAIRSFRVERITMVKRAFWDGFEKRAYDYAHEVSESGDYYKSRSKDAPASKLKSGLWGASLGGVSGALMGALSAAPSMFGKTKRLVPALIGGAIGLGVGGLTGVLGAISDKLGIDEAKRIMKMPPKERKNYLAHLARMGEISDREYNEWSRDFHKDLKEQDRHEEMMATLNRR